MTRAEHLAAAKARALEYVDQDLLVDAWSSLVAALKRHPETRDHPEIERGTGLLLGGHLSHEVAMRAWIDSVE